MTHVTLNFNQWLHISIQLLLYQTCYIAEAQRCGSQSSIVGKMLAGCCTYRKIRSNNSFECYMACHADVRCQSFNYVITKDLCELNNRTKEARPMHFVSNVERFYMKRDRNRGSLIYESGVRKQTFMYCTQRTFNWAYDKTDC